MRKILMVMGVLLLLNMAILSYVSNFNAGLVVQGLVSVGIILYAVFFEKVPKNLHITIGILCLIPLILVTFLCIYGNTNNATYDEDVVIVLGAGIRGERVSTPLARRLDKAVEYYSRNPDCIIAVCGGQGFQEDITEALAMERYLVARGIPREAIVKEENSTSTYENVSFAREILETRFPTGFSSVLITNDFHVYRAVRIARYAEVSVNHIGAHTEWYILPCTYLREMLAVANLWVMPPKAR
jgi:uncharacterized SAM-binding protein YcdF (DUF218 family)